MFPFFGDEIPTERTEARADLISIFYRIPDKFSVVASRLIFTRGNWEWRGRERFRRDIFSRGRETKKNTSDRFNCNN